MEEIKNESVRKNVEEMYYSKILEPLDNLYDIEDVSLFMKELSKKITFYKEYKKKKQEQIDKEVKSAENKHNFFKSVILKTLADKGERTVNFPGSCKVSSRKQKDKWIIENEVDFIEILQKEGEIDNVAKRETKYKIVKKEADKLLDNWDKNGKIDACVSNGKAFVFKEPRNNSLAIEYVEEEEKPREQDKTLFSFTKDNKDNTVNDFDTL